MLEEEKATGHPTGRRGNRSSYRKERQQVILQEGKATGQGHTTERKGNRSRTYYRKEKATGQGHTTGRKGNSWNYRKEGQQVILQKGRQ